MPAASAVLRYTTVPTLPSADGLSEADLPQHNSIRLTFTAETTAADLIQNLDALIAQRLPGRVRDSPSEVLYYPAGTFEEAINSGLGASKNKRGGAPEEEQQQQQIALDQPMPIAIPLGAVLLDVPAIAARYGASLATEETGVPSTRDQPFVFLVRRVRPAEPLSSSAALTTTNSSTNARSSAADPFAALLAAGGNDRDRMGSAQSPAAIAERLVAEKMAELRQGAAAATLARIEGNAIAANGSKTTTSNDGDGKETIPQRRVAWFERLKSYPNAAHLADTLEDEEEALSAYLRTVEARNAALKARRQAQTERAKGLREAMAAQSAATAECGPAVAERQALTAAIDAAKIEVEAHERRRALLTDQLLAAQREQSGARSTTSAADATAMGLVKRADSESPFVSAAGPSPQQQRVRGGPLLEQLEREYAAESQQQPKANQATSTNSGTPLPAADGSTFAEGAAAVDGASSSLSPQRKPNATAASTAAAEDPFYGDALAKVQARMGLGGSYEAVTTGEERSAIGNRPTAFGRGAGRRPSAHSDPHGAVPNNNGAYPAGGEWETAAGSASPRHRGEGNDHGEEGAAAYGHQQQGRDHHHDAYPSADFDDGGAAAALHERYSASPVGTHHHQRQQRQQQQQYQRGNGAVALFGGGGGHHHSSQHQHNNYPSTAAEFASAAFEELAAVDDSSWLLSPALAAEVSAVLSQPPSAALPLPRYLTAVTDRYTDLDPANSAYAVNGGAAAHRPTGAQLASDLSAYRARLDSADAAIANAQHAHLLHAVAPPPPPPSHTVKGASRINNGGSVLPPHLLPPPASAVATTAPFVGAGGGAERAAPPSSLSELMAAHDRSAYHHATAAAHGAMPPPPHHPQHHHHADAAASASAFGLVHSTVSLPPPPLAHTPYQHHQGQHGGHYQQQQLSSAPSAATYGMSHRGQALMAALEGRRAMAAQQPFFGVAPPANGPYTQSYDTASAAAAMAASGSGGGYFGGAGGVPLPPPPHQMTADPYPSGQPSFPYPFHHGHAAGGGAGPLLGGPAGAARHQQQQQYAR